MAQWCIPCSIQLSGRIIVKKYGCGERICGKRDQDKPLRRCEVGRSVSRRLAASNNVGYPYLPVQPWHRRSLLLLRLRSVRVGPRSPDRGADRGWTSSRASREQVPNPSLYMATQVSPIAATDESLHCAIGHPCRPATARTDPSRRGCSGFPVACPVNSC